MRILTLLLLFCPLVHLQQVYAEEPFLFPEIEGFQRTIIKEVYTADNLFDLIDGAADMFLTYDFVDLHMAEYSNDSLQYIRVEAYRHTTPENAFGVYAQERSPQSHFLPIGTEGYSDDGALNFWIGTYYIKLVTNDRGPHVQRALEKIALAVAQSFKCEATLPEQFNVFPREARREHGEYYVNRDFLNYSFFHTAFVVPYKNYTLFTLFYKTPKDAQAALQTYYSTVIKQNLPSTDTLFTVTDPQEGTLLFQCVGNILAGAKDIQDLYGARTDLETLVKRLQKQNLGK